MYVVSHIWSGSNFLGILPSRSARELTRYGLQKSHNIKVLPYLFTSSAPNLIHIRPSILTNPIHAFPSPELLLKRTRHPKNLLPMAPLRIESKTIQHLLSRRPRVAESPCGGVSDDVGMSGPEEAGLSLGKLLWMDIGCGLELGL